MTRFEHWVWRFLIILVLFMFGVVIANKTISDGDIKSVSIPSKCHYKANGTLPDPKCTPGAFNPAVTQRTINKTICVSGWTATVRPPVSYTEPIKFSLMKKYGRTDSVRNYELDHLIPLELGGSPASIKNLWPEPRSGEFGSYSKDGWENKLKREVCNGTLKLAAARKIMAKGTWINGT